MNDNNETSSPAQIAPAKKAKWILIIVMLVFVGINLFYGILLLKKPATQASVNAQTLTKAVPDFNFTDQDGEPFGLSDLKGKYWVTAFVFSRCPGPCPMITANLAQLHEDFKEHSNLHFVSFSIDPTHDTPEVLKKFAAQYYADHSRWSFLTGDQKTIHDFSINGFYSAVMETDPETAKDAGPFIHGTRVYIVDPEGTIIAAHDGTTQEGIEQIRLKLKEVLN